MPRLVALGSLCLLVPALVAADPPAVEKHLALQKAMLAARQYLDVNMPADAVAALEGEIANADGNKAFLTLLREAYLAELARLEKTPDAHEARIAQVKRHLALLGANPAASTAPAAAPPPAAPAVSPMSTPAGVPITPPSFDPPVLVPPPAGGESVGEAVALFKKGDYAAAARLFAAGAEHLSDMQKAAWAYSRIWVANERLNASSCDGATARALAADVTEALRLAPQNAELKKEGARVIAAANARARIDSGVVVGSPEAIETASFRVRHPGNRELGESIARKAETLRKEIFERWSGPPAAAWSVKCDIFIHATAEEYARATGRPTASTGNATIRLTNGNADERRIDLRADDPALESNALPRELTHVILADLFPDRPAPKWAVEGMAILAGTPEEIDRYSRTLRRCAKGGEWLGLAQLMELKDFPNENVTAFYCESVALTDYLVRAAGSERNFTLFLRDCHRYGTAQALKRQFNLDGPQALETAWKRAALEPLR
jgi:hypothetical protein